MPAIIIYFPVSDCIYPKISPEKIKLQIRNLRSQQTILKHAIIQNSRYRNVCTRKYSYQ